MGQQVRVPLEAGRAAADRREQRGVLRAAGSGVRPAMWLEQARRYQLKQHLQRGE
jgi:hypothetical protein